MQLYDYQKTGKDFLKERKFALLADDMGLGKSAQAIVAAQELGLSRILVLCPASVKYNWKKEIEKWCSASVEIINGRGATPAFNSTYTVVNYDLVPTKRIFLLLLGRSYDLIISDESHYLKNLKAKRTKCVYYPKGLKDRADRVWLLTGTPVLNRPLELYPHLRALTPERLHPFTSYVRYTERYCGAYNGKWGWDATGATNVPELAKRLDGFMLRRLKEDVLTELPDVVHQKVFINADKKLTSLAATERTEYEKDKENILGELASLRRQSGVLKVPHVLEYVKDLLESKRKAVVFAYHHDVIKALLEGLREYHPACITGATPSKDRQEAVERFRRVPDCRVFIGQIEAGGTGIDGLQDVCDAVVFAEMSWVPGQIHQAIGRCHRIGQKNTVVAHYLIVENSVDEDIVSSVEKKEAVIKRLIQPTMTNKEGEEEMPTENEKRVAVTVTVEVDAVTICDAIVAVGNGMKTKGAEVTKIHGAQVVLNIPSTVAGTPATASKPVPEPTKTTAVEEEAPKRTRKAKVAEPVEAPKAQPVDDVDFGGGAEAPKALLTAEEFLKYCNSKLNAIGDPTARKAVTQKVAAMFREKFNCMAVRQIPVERLEEAKAGLDAILAEGVK